MARVIDVAHVECDHMRPLQSRFLKPGDHGVDSHELRRARCVSLRVRLSYSLDSRFGADPEIRGRNHSLLLRCDPDRLASVPRPIENGFRIAERVRLPTSWIEESVGDDSVGLRVLSGHYGVVIWEGLRRKDGDETS